MTDHDALLTTILANRDDDTARLVYADYLDERGGPGDGERAEFIRCQVELAAIYPPEPFQWHWPEDRAVMMQEEPPNFSIGIFPGIGPLNLSPGQSIEDGWVDFHFRGKVYQDLLMTLDPSDAAIGAPVRAKFRPHPKGPYPHRERFKVLCRRERELWHQLSTDRIFTPPGFKIGVINHSAPEFGLEPYGKCNISRGFVSALTCTWTDWSKHADAILTRQPIERVRLTTMPTAQLLRSRTKPMGRFAKLTGRDIVHFLEGEWRDGFDLATTAAYALLSHEWPGIKFELPPVTVACAAGT